MKRLFFAAVVAFGLGPVASAQELAPPTSQEELALRRNILTYPQAELGRLMGGLGSIAPNGTYNLPFPSQIRAEAVHALRRQAAEKLLRYDSDGDGAISQTEARAVLESGFEGRQDEMTAFLATADANGDGALSVAEIEGLKDRFAEQNLAANLRPRRLLRGIDPAVFDLDGDRKVRRDELVRYVELVIAAGPARIDPPSETGPCTLPPVSTGAVVTLVGGQGGGAALADHTVAGPDAETQVVYLDLPEGQRPVYLMLRVNGPTIYQFGGAVDRIEHVVAGHVDGAVGIKGVDA